MIDLAKLPDDVDTLKVIIAGRDERIEQLEVLVKAFKQALFGRKSEKINPDQFEMALEDIETAIEVVNSEQEADEFAPEAKPPKQRAGNRGALPKHLPRIENIIEPEDKTCACGGKLHVIGEDTSERLDIIPARFQVIVTRRPKYACRTCEDGITQMPAPAHLVPAGLPTENLIAHVLVSKYADHLPLYRQVQIYARQGLELDRSTLASWVGKAAFELTPVFECLLENLKTSTKLYMDETRAPVLDPGRGKTKTGYFWALARDDRPWDGDDPPGVAFTYAPGRSGQYADDILQGFEGILQVDGYAGYNRLLNRNSHQVQLAYCWAHARRKLYEVAKNSTAPIAREGLKRIGELYQIEADIRGQSPQARLAVRQERTTPKLAAFETWLNQTRACVSAKTPLGAALKYIARYWNGLILFANDGRVEIDNNAVERTIRPIALNRKNALFAGHDAGAKNWGIIASLIETCKLNNINPHDYLADVLTAIVNGHKQRIIDELLPWNWQKVNEQLLYVNNHV